MKIGVLLLACAVLVGCSADKPVDKPVDNRAAAGINEAQHLPKVPLRIRHGELAPDRLMAVEMALTPEQQEKGLMHRTDLKPGEGMLFPMVPPRMPSFWMKDTPLSLDLVFIGIDGGIVRIIAGARPNDRTPLFAEVPVAGVLELRAGEAKALALDEGDHIRWGACARASQPGSPVVEAENFCP